MRQCNISIVQGQVQSGHLDMADSHWSWIINTQGVKYRSSLPPPSSLLQSTLSVQAAGQQGKLSTWEGRGGEVLSVIYLYHSQEAWSDSYLWTVQSSSLLLLEVRAERLLCFNFNQPYLFSGLFWSAWLVMTDRQEGLDWTVLSSIKCRVVWWNSIKDNLLHNMWLA